MYFTSIKVCVHITYSTCSVLISFADYYFLNTYFVDFSSQKRHQMVNMDPVSNFYSFSKNVVTISDTYLAVFSVTKESHQTSELTGYQSIQ